MKREDRKKVLREKFERTFILDRASVNAESRTVDMAFSSQKPCERWWGVEVLDHSPGCVRMDRMNDGAPLLNSHDMTKQIGVIESASLGVDGVGRCKVRFSKNADAQEVFADVVDGIKSKVSVGYQVHNMVEMKPDEMNEEQKQMCLDNGTKCYRVNDWEPLEASIVSIPADSSVGVGRDLTNQNDEPTQIKEVITMADVKTPEQIAQETQIAERERVTEIEAIAAQYNGRVANMEDMKRNAVNLKINPVVFRDKVWSKITDEKPLMVSASDLGMSPKEVKQYSIGNAIRAQITGKGGDFERECSDQVAKNLGQAARGFYVPQDIQLRGMESRVLTVGSATAGGNVVGTNLQPQNFIDLLRAKMVTRGLGLSVLPGLVGNVAIPSQTGASTAYWVTENSAATTSNITLGQVTLSPKTVGGFTDVSRQLILQSTPAIDGLVTNDLARVLAIAIDTAVLVGLGNSGQPKGIQVSTSADGSTVIGALINGSAFTYIVAISFESKIAGYNASSASMAWVTTPAVRGTLKGRLKFASATAGDYVLSEDNTMVGYPLVATTSMTTGNLLLGDFSQAMLGEWGTLDVLVDPYTGSSAGTVRIVAFDSVDVGVRQPGAFAGCSSTTAVVS
jgi:HK97 family phage major capsid protein